jgi:hypothetical protein
MTAPTDPAEPLPDLDPADAEVIHRIAEESRKAQGLPLEITDPTVLNMVARFILAAEKGSNPPGT